MDPEPLTALWTPIDPWNGPALSFAAKKRVSTSARCAAYEMTQN